jgi:hypothetical protein
MKDLAAIYNEFLPWSDPQIEGVEAQLSSIRQVSDRFKITVRFLDEGVIIGGVRYVYDPEDDHLTAVDFQSGGRAGEGLLRRYHDDSLAVFKKHIDWLSVRLFDERVAKVFADADWEQDKDDPSLWTIKND